RRPSVAAMLPRRSSTGGWTGHERTDAARRAGDTAGAGDATRSTCHDRPVYDRHLPAVVSVRCRRIAGDAGADAADTEHLPVHAGGDDAVPRHAVRFLRTQAGDPGEPDAVCRYCDRLRAGLGPRAAAVV